MSTTSVVFNLNDVLNKETLKGKRIFHPLLLIDYRRKEERR